MLKKCKLVMLSSSEKASNFGLFTDILNEVRLYFKYNLNSHKDFKYQHLYILSDDQIKEDDWCINKNLDTLYQVKDIPETYNPSKDWYKIIATTNISLNLPSISQSFIKKYIEKYNKGKKIVEVNVVYESMNTTIINRDFNDFEPKVKNNTVSIKKIKTSWNREEVTKLLYLALATGSVYGNEINESDANNWIKENL